MYNVYISSLAAANLCLRPQPKLRLMLHGRYYNYSDAWMAVAIASHRFRLSGLMDACLAGIHFFYAVFIVDIQRNINCKFFVSGFFMGFAR